MSSKPPASDVAQRLDEVLAAPAHMQLGELKVLTLRRQARHLFWSALILIVTCGAVPLYAGSFNEEWKNLAVLGGGALVVLLFVLVPFFRWLGRTTVVTTKRVIVRSGVLSRDRSEVPFTQIRELTVKRGLFQRIFGAGNIVLQSAGADPFVLINVPRVKGVAQSLQELVEWQYASQQFLAAQGGQGFGAPGYGTPGHGAPGYAGQGYGAPSYPYPSHPFPGNTYPGQGQAQANDGGSPVSFAQG
ncbi:MAG: PH domain-containing protein [Microbacteriaceae bacterium]